MSFEISVPGGESKRLLTAGKYCDRDIVVTAERAEPVVESDVNFYDYDGTLLYAYTLAEAQALTELPPLPTHEGLVCQGWNWSLADIQTAGLPVDVGANYTTSDGKTRLLINLRQPNQLSVSYFVRGTGLTLEIDWGDGSSPETTAVNYQYVSHTYPNTGRYTIALTVVSGTLDIGAGDSTYSTVNDVSILESVNVGDGVDRIFYASFLRMDPIISIPRTLTSLSGFGSSFVGCVVVPPGVSLGTSAFNSALRCRPILSNSVISGTYAVYNCGAKRIVISADTTSIPVGAFGLTDIKEVVIPEGVAQIGASAFYGCYQLTRIRFLPANPPAVANSNAFTGLPETVYVEVPAASLEAYQNATNYSGIAAQIVGV